MVVQLPLWRGIKSTAFEDQALAQGEGEDNKKALFYF